MSPETFVASMKLGWERYELTTSAGFSKSSSKRSLLHCERREHQLVFVERGENGRTAIVCSIMLGKFLIVQLG